MAFPVDWKKPVIGHEPILSSGISSSAAVFPYILGSDVLVFLLMYLLSVLQSTAKQCSSTTFWVGLYRHRKGKGHGAALLQKATSLHHQKPATNGWLSLGVSLQHSLKKIKGGVGVEIYHFSLLKSFRWVCPTSCVYLHPLPNGMHVRPQKQSTSGIFPASAVVFYTSHLGVWGLFPLLYWALHCVSPCQHYQLTQHLSQNLSTWCKHRVISLWCTRGVNILQAHPCE